MDETRRVAQNAFNAKISIGPTIDNAVAGKKITGGKMSEPIQARPMSKRYLGNSDRAKLQVHDLRNEKACCQITEFVEAGHAVYFIPDILVQAFAEGFASCQWCIEGRN